MQDQQPASGRGAPATCEPMVRLVGIRKAFGSHQVLDGLDLALEPGKCTVILGPSGTGKSVMLKHIVGLIRPDAGEVYFQGQRVDTASERALVRLRTRIGFLFQMGALFDSMTVGQNVAFPLEEHTRQDEPTRRAAVDRVLRMVGLPGVEHKMPADLSGGQRKRVALARAIVLEPELMLYDEPTTGLDPVRSDVINELIITLGRNLGITSVVVTHDMHSANRIADRMVLLQEGRVIADAEPDRFRELSDPRVQRFIHGRADPDDVHMIRQAFEEAQRGR